MRGVIFGGPNWDCFGEEGVTRDRSEITTVEAGLDMRIHQENLIGCDATAALPDGHLVPVTVGLLRLSQTDPIDRDAAVKPANDLSRQAGDMFEKWDIWWQIAPVRDECGDRVGRSHGDEIARAKMVDRLQTIEADWDGGAGIPEEQRWHCDGS